MRTQPDFLQTYLQKPAFLTEICGDYLTQFSCGQVVEAVY